MVALVDLSCILLNLFVWLVGFITSSSTAKLYRELAPRLTSDNYKCCHTTRQSGETMTSVSAGHIILTPIQPVGSGDGNGTIQFDYLVCTLSSNHANDFCLTFYH